MARRIPIAAGTPQGESYTDLEKQNSMQWSVNQFSAAERALNHGF
ncbi:MAG: hypothetical protein WBC04_05220 [Candidatus Acidiferrales bacterium]